MKKRMIAIVLAAVMAFSAPTAFTPAKVKAAASSQSFNKKDLPEQVVTTLGIMTRDSKGSLNLTKTVTRAQFAKMLVYASPYKDKIGRNANTALYKDVKKNHWAAPYIKIAVAQGWMGANLSGKFRPGAAITLQEAVNGIVGLLGYKNEDFQGNKDSAKMALYKGEDIDTHITKKSTQKITRKDAMNLFYNTLIADTKEKQVYAVTLGYTLDAAGDMDYLTLVDNKMKGPVIASKTWTKQIPFSTKNAVFYRNGTKSKAASIKLYDVLYYSKNLKTIWAYSDKVTGKYSAVSPNRLTPKQVTIAGKTYDIGDQEAAYQLSTLGPYDIGDNITLLLGKDKTVVGVRGTIQNNTIIGGLVIEKGKRENSGKDEDASIGTYIRMVDATGVEHEYDCDTEKISVSDPVQISFIGDKTIVNPIELYSMYGKVDEKAEKLGTYKFAEDVNILDYKNGIYKTITKKRLAGINLYSADIRYYHLNDSNEITDLILWDVTGDIYDYGILLEANEGGYVPNVYGNYTYEINGTRSAASTNVKFGVDQASGPAQFAFDNGKLVGLKTLGYVEVTALSEKEVFNGKETKTIADEAVFYLYKDGSYYQTELSKVADLKKYDLKAYYDQSVLRGGRVRIIVAKAK